MVKNGLHTTIKNLETNNGFDVRQSLAADKRIHDDHILLIYHVFKNYVHKHYMHEHYVILYGYVDVICILQKSEFLV